MLPYCYNMPSLNNFKYMVLGMILSLCRVSAAWNATLLVENVDIAPVCEPILLGFDCTQECGLSLFVGRSTKDPTQ